MKLRNTEQYIEIIDFDPLAGIRTRNLVSSTDKIKTNGFFYELKGSLYGLGVEAGELWVVVGGVAYIASEITATCLPDGKYKEFTVYRNKTPLSSVRYKPEEPHWNFFTMEDEDVDSLLLINNILKSAERKQIFIEANNG